MNNILFAIFYTEFIYNTVFCVNPIFVLYKFCPYLFAIIRLEFYILTEFFLKK